MLLTQLSILFLYRRVFTFNTIWFKKTLYVLGLLCFGFNISIAFAILFACTPVNLAWDKSLPGHCIEVRTVYLVHTVLILVLDICIVAAPMPLVWNLHTNSKTKGAVASMFMLGGLLVFACDQPPWKNTQLNFLHSQRLHHQPDKTSLPCKNCWK